VLQNDSLKDEKRAITDALPRVTLLCTRHKEKAGQATVRKTSTSAPRGLIPGMERGEKGAPLIVPKVGHRSNTVMAVTKLYIRKRSQLNY
jgi:hypothetical protein